MNDTVFDASVDAHDAPTTRVGKPFIAGLAIANLGLWTATFGPLPVLLPLQVAQVSAGSKEEVLGWVTALGALVAIITNPLAGGWSDHTRSRWGRRLPWLFGGALAGAASLLLLGQQQAVAGIVLGWCAAQFALNVMLAALNAEVPDCVPVAQRAVCGAWVGVTQLLGASLGAAVATHGSVAQGYLVIALFLLASVAPFPWLARAGHARAVLPALPPRDAPRQPWWVDPRRHPDFAWAWCMRFMVNVGNTVGTVYLLYYLDDRVHYARLFPGQAARDGLLVLVALYSIGGLAGSLLGGWLSDRLARRKPVILTAVVVMIAGLLLLAVTVSWHWVMLAAVLEGVGYGAYVAVDLALVSQVLPRPEDRGKDLGLVNIASAAPLVVGPAVAALLVTRLGGYAALYLVAALATLVGGIAAAMVRGVR